MKQAGEETFNKNRLLNAGYNFAKQRVLDLDFDCIIFHDTDLLLENGTNIYTCDPERVTHLCPEVDTVRFKLFGVTLLLENLVKFGTVNLLQTGLGTLLNFTWLGLTYLSQQFIGLAKYC